MDKITKIRLKHILLNLHNQGIDWNKLGPQQKIKYLKGIATIPEANEVYAEIGKENDARTLRVGIGTDR